MSCIQPIVTSSRSANARARVKLRHVEPEPSAPPGLRLMDVRSRANPSFFLDSLRGLSAGTRRHHRGPSLARDVLERQHGCREDWDRPAEHGALGDIRFGSGVGRLLDELRRDRHTHAERQLVGDDEVRVRQDSRGVQRILLKARILAGGLSIDYQPTRCEESIEV